MTVELTTNTNAEIYYTGKYWNDLLLVRQHINSKISGDPDLQPDQHFSQRYGTPFRSALMLNCGNGWVERTLFDQGTILSAVGIDYSRVLLDEARSMAEEMDLPVEYREMDVNSAAFPDNDFDLVVNWAAAHHVAYLDRVFRALCHLLPEEGLLLSFDYVGPHRNQYDAEAWEAAWKVNERLPKQFRQDLRYPHLPTMLGTDPTEAIHSELVLDTFRRYFRTEEYVPLGGALAYPLLTFNDGLFAAEDERERDEWVLRILEEDDAFLATHPGSSLFAYFVGKPAKEVLRNRKDLARWTREETEREATAASRGGEYYPRGALQSAYAENESLKARLEEANVRIGDLERDLEIISGSVSYRIARRASGSELLKGLRTHAAPARGLDWLRNEIAKRL